jgi:6,7-dimethyl-8-ribityllumazine synthase
MKHIAIVLGSFHKKEVEEMLDEARKAAEESGLTIVEEVWVPGSYEKPLALKKLLMRPDVDGAVVLGIIEEGETAHGLVMGHVVHHAIVDLQLEFMKPIGVGILGPEIVPVQFAARVRPYARAAVLAAGKILSV